MNSVVDQRDLLPRSVVAVVLSGMAALFLTQMSAHYPIEHWLVWRYVRYWAWIGVLSLGWLGVGETIVLRLVGRIRGLHAHLFVSGCTGMLLFGLLMFVAGLLQLYNRWLFWGLPAAFFVAALPRLWILRRDLLPRLRRRSPLGIQSMTALAILAFGLVAWLFVYAGVMVPDNIAFDSRWKHLALAETFVGHGGIFRFDQGWLFAARPHFASYLYAWAFLAPGSDLFDRIELSAHLELAVVLWTTLLAIPALVRRVVPDADPKLVWVARFLFPGVLLYDSNLSAGADHIGAAFAIPIFVLTHDFVRRRFDVRYGVLLAAMSAGCVLTKETAAALVIPSATLVILVAAAQHSIAVARKRRPGRMFAWLPGVAALCAVGLALLSPLWLKNLIWYGDPLYPVFREYFTPTPWNADSEYLLEYGYLEYQFSMWQQTDGNQLWETLKVLLTWSFVPHDWKAFHGVKPVIGSLATLLLPGLLFLRRSKGLWALVLWIHVGIAVWFQVMPQDRYLQVLMPFMAAFTAAMIVRMWRARMRVGIVVLVGAQITWSGDVPFISRNQLPALAKLLAAGDDGQYEARFRTQGEFEEVGLYMPRGSRLLVHETHPHLGVRVAAIPDFQTWQFGLSYGLMHSPRELWTRYREMGITHLWWKEGRSRSWDSVAGDLLFFELAHRHTEMHKDFGSSRVGRLSTLPPPAEDAFNDLVLVLGCRGKGFPTGVYRLRDLHVPIFGPDAEQYGEPLHPADSKREALRMVPDVGFVVSDAACHRKVDPRITTDFDLVAARKRVSRTPSRPYALFVRKPGEPEQVQARASGGDTATERPITLAAGDAKLRHK